MPGEIKQGGEFFVSLLDQIDRYREAVYEILKENPDSKCPILRGITTISTEDIPFDYFIQPKAGDV